MRNIIILSPQTRVNDHWIMTDQIDATPNQIRVADDRIFGAPNDLLYRFQANFYEQFACDIVSETLLHYPYPYISEKTLRPISSKRMFILLGAPGSLQLLHDKGFVTFGDIIDESYDQINDPQTRFLAVTNEIEKFCSISLVNIKSYMDSIADRLEHNFQILQNLQQTELEEFSKILDNDKI